MYDFKLMNGLIVDGSGAEPYRADVAVSRGKIVRIAPSLAQRSEEADAGQTAKTFDVSGKIVAPGFIDMHSHSDLVYLGPHAPDAKVRQGITTELLGQDGLGVAPVEDGDKPLLAELTNGLLGYMPLDIWTWNSFEEYLEVLEKAPLPCNLAVLASHGPIRVKAMGMPDRAPDRAELARMKGLVRECMAAGAFGLSTGLIYPPCSYGERDEITELIKELALYEGVFVVHQRDEGYNLPRSFDEVAGAAEDAGVRLHISHLQACGKVNWPQMDLVLERSDERIARGQKITWDRYPYLAGCTVLTAVLPRWVFSQGTRALIANLMVPEYRERIRKEYDKGLDVWNNRSISVGWENIVVSGVRSEKNKWMEGKDCRELARRTSKDPVDFVCDLLAEEELAVTMISHYGSVDVLAKVLSHPSATIGTDGIYCGSPHPRLYGSYPRLLQEFVVRQHRMTWQEAICKCTSQPASILGLTDRGLIREGMAADLVVIDPERIADNSTYENPAMHPCGIDLVMVNGEAVVNSAGTTKCLPGRVLRKGR